MYMYAYACTLKLSMIAASFILMIEMLIIYIK